MIRELYQDRFQLQFAVFSRSRAGRSGKCREYSAHQMRGDDANGMVRKQPVAARLGTGQTGPMLAGWMTASTPRPTRLCSPKPFRSM